MFPPLYNMTQNTEPVLVAINCLAFNHGSYIKECLEGFVMQKTNFRFVAIVHEDASTDDTARIIREYATKYPNIVKPIFESENQYSKGGFTLIGNIMSNAIKQTGCKYVAYCEGDDYWTDPYKLQKQVDILESNKDITLVHSNFETVDSNSQPEYRAYFEDIKKKSKNGEVLKTLFEWNHIMTVSCCIRREVLENNLYINCPYHYDYTTFFTAAMLGNVAYIRDKTCCYRNAPQSITNSRGNELSKRLELIYEYFSDAFIKGKYEKHIGMIRRLFILKRIFSHYAKAGKINTLKEPKGLLPLLLFRYYKK